MSKKAKVEISLKEKIKCQWCNKKSTLEDWENNTYKECINREMKRAYTHLYEKRAFIKSTDSYYKCPQCGKWLAGSELIIVDSNNKKLEKLGRQSIICIENE